jgi:hypothetical protein
VKTATRPTSFATALETHVKGNRLGAETWDLYARHRAHVMRALLAAAPAEPGTLVLLGAGNCNDVDLAALSARFNRIHLVDLDAAALGRARDRAPAGVRARITLHAPIDLTGLLARLDDWARARPPLAEVQAAIAPAVDGITRGLPVGDADVVASCCALTQLSWSLTVNVGEEHPAIGDLRTAMMTIHLRTLAALARGGGTALVLSDVLSNRTYPLDELPGDADLQALFERVVAENRFYAGSNPRLIGQLLRRDPVLSSAFAPARSLAPWLWTGQLDRTYLVYGLALERRPR